MGHECLRINIDGMTMSLILSIIGAFHEQYSIALSLEALA